ncbi:MAG: hypothetical protein IKX71_02700 [Bacteroidales bacterium]|nr:hypothetical protein [Bacteroidales bacterium]
MEAGTSRLFAYKRHLESQLSEWRLNAKSAERQSRSASIAYWLQGPRGERNGNAQDAPASEHNPDNYFCGVIFPELPHLLE